MLVAIEVELIDKEALAEKSSDEKAQEHDDHHKSVDGPEASIDIVGSHITAESYEELVDRTLVDLDREFVER